MKTRILGNNKKYFQSIVEGPVQMALKSAKIYLAAKKCVAWKNLPYVNIHLGQFVK